MDRPNTEKGVEDFKAGKTGDEAWVARITARRAEERTREGSPTPEPTEPEKEKETPMEARSEDGGVVQIYPEFSGTKYPVKLEFSRAPDLGTIMHLKKPVEEQGGAGFDRVCIVEEPLGGVKKQEGAVYIRMLTRDELEARRTEAAAQNLELKVEDMRDYLTEKTLEQLKISRPETAPVSA